MSTVIEKLQALAQNLWWSWDAAATELWHDLDPWQWRRCNHNPVALLRDLGDDRLNNLLTPDMRDRVNEISQRFDSYLADPNTWAAANPTPSVAYFSMEFGLHESIRLYSGGLGVLAGDHVRSASDLGIDLVGVGLLYRHGYFHQLIDEDQQVAAYPTVRFPRLPVHRATDIHGAPAEVEVQLADETLVALVWILPVGRSRLILLDTDHDRNTAEHRALTHALYGGDTKMRISQEVLLGIGGVAALRTLGLRPDLVHLNEGHCAFAPIALYAEARDAGIPQPMAHVRSRCVFTTHTPVPAGHDRFGWELANWALGPWRVLQGLPKGLIMDLGRVDPRNLDETLCMTVLALRCSRAANGVSALHGAVSRDMWKELWPKLQVDDVPISHITNGVHPTFWMAPEAREVFDQHIPGWRDQPWNAEIWEQLDAVSDKELWSLRNTLRSQLVEAVAERTGVNLDPARLTIGFARRFAPYKRGNLIFRDEKRALALLEQGAQLVFAGKAHPRDRSGQEVLASVVRWADHHGFRGRVAFVPNYDIELGRILTAGADLWLNNPRRPREASGTSGQKVVLNGGLNLSTIDGWWPEGYDSTNGWVIGTDQDYPDLAEQDQADSDDLYRVLEQEVLPAWLDRDDQGLPSAWIRRIRRSIRTCAPLFTSHRMVRDYALEMYTPACT